MSSSFVDHLLAKRSPPPEYSVLCSVHAGGTGGPIAHGSQRIGGVMDEIEKIVPTEEVGSEGGGTGDLEIGQPAVPGTGSEATETWRPQHERPEEIRPDESGRGRRSP
jgi:hypothetical protein